MENEFIPYNLAVKLKDLGFNLPCYVYIYTGDTGNNYDHYIGVKPIDSRDWNGKSDLCVSRPTFSQTFRWFREKYGLSGWVDESFGGNLRRGVVSIKSEIGSKFYPTTTKLFYTYEEAELDCLTNLIEIVEQKEII
jgi:hypothetical protein